MRLRRSSRAGLTIATSALGLWLLVSGCASSGPVHAALYEDLPSLRRQIELSAARGKLDKSGTFDIARAVASREVSSAEGKGGVRRVRALSPCARPLSDVLRERAEIHDDVGAEAMLALLPFSRKDPGSLVERYGQDPSPSWRAVAARSALSPSDVLQRRAWFVDPDERVRRGALEAAVSVPEASDLPALLEAFRLDPDPLSRSFAARAAGAIGGEAAVLGLLDRFARADETDRMTVIEAWAMPAAYASGGARELRAAAEGRLGVVSVAAAAALIRMGDRDGALSGLLATTIEHGAEDERRLAIMLAPATEPRVADALKLATKDKNPEVVVVAWARLLTVPARAAEAKQALRAIAGRQGTDALEARAALASAGDRNVVTALIGETSNGSPARRGQAAVALYRLGEPARAATALADPDPGVRVAVACGILLASR